MKEIKFYRTQSDKVPVKEFLDSLSSKQAQKIAWVLELVERLDQVPVQYFKKLKSTDDIWEVRARIGSNSFRILGFMDGDKFVVLTNGFSKKSQKTPKQDTKYREALLNWQSSVRLTTCLEKEVNNERFTSLHQRQKETRPRICRRV